MSSWKCHRRGCRAVEREQATDVLTKAVLRLSPKDGVGAGAVKVQVAGVIALQRDLVRHPAADDMPEENSANQDFRV